MTSHSIDRLVYMANQIGREFGFQQPDAAAEATADHLRKFWDPRMRALIREHEAGGGQGMSETARAAVAMLHGDGAVR